MVTGQPGVGKTFLLYNFAVDCGAKFVISNNLDEVIAALGVSCPKIIIVDDASERIDLLKRLIHFRIEKEIDFRIIAVCWPYEQDTVRSSMGTVNTVQLGLISADNIVDLVRQEFSNAGINAENWLLQEIQQQAAGRPGLAICLVELLVANKNTRPLIEGTAHFDLLERAFHELKKEDTSGLLAAFAVGGDFGMRMEDVARVLMRDVIQVAQNLKTLATGGIIREHKEQYVETCPPAFRHALLIKEFLSGNAFSPVSTYKALFDTSPSKKYALLTLVCAIAKGAVIDNAWLILKIRDVDDNDVWRRLAWVNREWCSWVLDHYRGEIIDIAEACLKFMPEIIIPRLLDSMVGDTRPKHSHPNSPGRKIDKWIAKSCRRPGESIKKRRLLLDATKEWLQNGGDPDAAWRCLAKCVRIQWETFESTPGSGKSGIFTNGIICLPDVKALLSFWDDLLEIAESYLPNNWVQVVNALHEWDHPYLRGREPDNQYMALTKATIWDFIHKLVEVPNVPKHVLVRWGIQNGYFTEKEGNSEFLVFCPLENYGDDKDYTIKEQERHDAALILGQKWANLKPDDVAERLQKMEIECRRVEITYPLFERQICETITESISDHEMWLTTFNKYGLSPDAIVPFLRKLASKNHPTADTWLQVLLQDKRYSAHAVTIALTRAKLSDPIIELVMNLIQDNPDLVEGILVREDISRFWLEYLADKASGYLALIVALNNFRSRSKRLLNTNRQQWLELFYRGIEGIEFLNGHLFFDLEKIVQDIPEIRLPLINKLLENEQVYNWTTSPKYYQELLDSLNQDEKRDLLPRLEDVCACEFTAWVIADDLELYSELLANAELKQHHLMPLIGDPSSLEWQKKTGLAMDFGYKPENIARSVLGNVWFSSGSEVVFWQGWLNKFESLKKSKNQRMQEIADYGIQMTKNRIEHAKQKEQEEDVLGLDYGE